MRKLALATAVLTIVGCAPMSRLPTVDQNLTQAEREKQMELALRENMKRIDRLNNIGWQILASNADACGEKTRAGLGLNAQNAESMPKEYRKTFEKLFGQHDKSVVISVAPGSPADKAGIRQGDIVLNVDGRDASGSEGRKQLLKALSEMKPGNAIGARVQRGTNELNLMVSPQTVCSYPVRMTQSDAVNAFADGKQIVVTTGMLRFATSDNELALVIGHELAHNTQEHIKAKMGNQLLGALLGAAVSVAIKTDVTRTGADIGGMAYSKEFEAEADYVGTYYVAKAGFPVETAAEFWRRMAVEHPKAIGHGTTHPDTASRFTAIEAAAKEVSDKRNAGVALVPERK